jgi:hypothetical protein
MFATLGRTWALAKQSFAVLRADKEIMLFPVMSAIAAIIVSASFAIPVLMTEGILPAKGEEPGAALYAALFVFYYLNYFVIIFFNSALVACANIRLSGGDPTVGDGLRMATSRIGRIATWALVASTVGLILRVLEERAEKIGQLVIALIGAAWTLITYFMVPVIIFEDRSIFDSLKRSASIFRHHWGEQVSGGLGFGLLFFLLAIPGFILGFVGFLVHPVAGIVVAVLYFLILAAVFSAVRGIFVVALYRYATKGEAPAGFQADMLENAFARR